MDGSTGLEGLVVFAAVVKVELVLGDEVGVGEWVHIRREFFGEHSRQKESGIDSGLRRGENGERE